PYIEEIDGEVSVRQVLEFLEEDGYIPLVNYIEDEFGVRGSGNDLQFNYRGSLENPDIVIPKMFDDPRAYEVEVEDALFDSTLIGIQTGSEERQNALARLLNTPLYRELFQTFSNSIGVEWFRINFGQLRDIPVIEEALSQEVFDRMDPFFPPENDNDLVRLNQILVESSSAAEVEGVLRRYLASRDDYAWAWLMTLPEFKEFQQLVEEDEEAAKEFVLDRFDEELLDEARDTFNNIDFFENRRNLLNDLLMEFEEEHYRGFLAGIVLQFEGVLTDLVTQTGGDIDDDSTPTKFEMPGQSRKTKNLNELITQFFDGEFSSYLDKTVRNRRNEIAHGRVFEDSEKLSIHFFISFYALCNASLNQYVRLAGD
ncbi:MAG: N-6 adenine-specific DNA methylase domain-containing protein, partial [Halobacteriaceae archaeon]